MRGFPISSPGPSVTRHASISSAVSALSGFLTTARISKDLHDEPEERSEGSSEPSDESSEPSDDDSDASVDFDLFSPKTPNVRASFAMRELPSTEARRTSLYLSSDTGAKTMRYEHPRALTGSRPVDVAVQGRQQDQENPMRAVLRTTPADALRPNCRFELPGGIERVAFLPRPLGGPRPLLLLAGGRLHVAVALDEQAELRKLQQVAQEDVEDTKED